MPNIDEDLAALGVGVIFLIFFSFFFVAVAVAGL
jgi:hypothetical protein